MPFGNWCVTYCQYTSEILFQFIHTAIYNEEKLYVILKNLYIYI